MRSFFFPLPCESAIQALTTALGMTRELTALPLVRSTAKGVSLWQAVRPWSVALISPPSRVRVLAAAFPLLPVAGFVPWSLSAFFWAFGHGFL
jgi:hypothetical protein